MTPPPAAPATTTPTVVIVAGGAPDVDELAALAIALTPVPATSPPTRPAVPAWARAALLEGAGGVTAVRPSDLRRRAG